MTVRTGSRQQDLRDFIRMTEEGLAFQMAEDGTQDAKMVEMLAKYKAELADLQAKGMDLPGIGHCDGAGTGTARALHARPKAGAPAKNQYGTFTVAYASAKQTAFIKGLLDSRDLSKIADSVTLDVARLREQVAAQQVNKRAASAIIDRLLALPELATSARVGYSGSSATGAHQKETTMTTATTQRPASDKQYAFITSLANEKALDADDRAKVLAAVEAKSLSAKGASATIEKLMALPKAATPATEIEAGVYTDGTTTLRVYLGQNSGKMLAAEAIRHEDGTAEFDYRGAASRFVTAAFRKMTIEEAAAWGKATGTCVVCARRLDVPESVDRGIGPVCFAKMGG